MVLTTLEVTGLSICHECIPAYDGPEYGVILMTEQEALQRNPAIYHYICCIQDSNNARSEACEARKGRMIKQGNDDE
jgi:hypothetical protein